MSRAMSRKPRKNQHSRARELWAFRTGRITRDEYMDCLHGHSFVRGNKFYCSAMPEAFGWAIRRMKKPVPETEL